MYLGIQEFVPTSQNENAYSYNWGMYSTYLSRYAYQSGSRLCIMQFHNYQDHSIKLVVQVYSLISIMANLELFSRQVTGKVRRRFFQQYISESMKRHLIEKVVLSR